MKRITKEESVEFEWKRILLRMQMLRKGFDEIVDKATEYHELRNKIAQGLKKFRKEKSLVTQELMLEGLYHEIYEFCESILLKKA